MTQTAKELIEERIQLGEATLPKKMPDELKKLADEYGAMALCLERSGGSSTSGMMGGKKWAVLRKL